MSYLEFEKPIIELRKKISELKKLMDSSDIDLSNEVLLLERSVKEVQL